jgi:hypothetical protein
VVTESSLYKGGQGNCMCSTCASVPYLHTHRDLQGPACLQSLEAKVRSWLTSLLGPSAVAVCGATVHYPCGPIFATLHVHFRVNVTEEHELGTGRLFDLSLRPVLPLGSAGGDRNGRDEASSSVSNR